MPQSYRRWMVMALLLVLIPSASLLKGSSDDAATPCHNPAGNNNFIAVLSMLQKDPDRKRNKKAKVEIDLPPEWLSIYEEYAKLRNFTLGDCIREAMLSDIRQTSEITEQATPMTDGFRVKVIR